MNASSASAFALALTTSVVLSACAGGASDDPTGEPIKNDPQAHATGTVWVASQNTFGTSRKPAVTLYNMETGDKTRSADLSRNPKSMILTAKYAWVLCDKGLLARVTRADMRVDSMQLTQKTTQGSHAYQLAADENSVWIGDAYEGFIHIDPESLAEIGRMTFTNPTLNSVDALALVAGNPWALMGGSSFRLIRLDAAGPAIAATLPLGENPSDALGPRVAGRTGYGTMGITGNQALVYAYTDKKLLRVDLAGGKIESLWNADWIRWEALRVNGRLDIRGYAQGFMVANTDSLWIRRLGLSGQEHSQAAVKHYVTLNAMRSDGLMAVGYDTSDKIGEVGLFRAASLDTVRSVEFTWDQAALALE